MYIHQLKHSIAVLDGNLIQFAMFAIKLLHVLSLFFSYTVETHPRY